MINTPALRIGALAKASGVSPDTLRYYEKLGLLPRSHRSTGGFREFGASAIDRIQFVSQWPVNPARRRPSPM